MIFFNFSHIIITDMAFIRPGMHRNTISAEALYINSCFYHIRIIAAS